MKKRIFLTALLSAGVIAAHGQEPARGQDELTKQLEVTRAYTPQIGRASKLAIEPNMTDTVRLRPDISYSITPTASPVEFSTRPFSPATLAAASLGDGPSLYVRAGAGVPVQSTLDVYFTSRMKAGSTLGLFLNHRGSYSKIDNDIATPKTSVEMLNGGGIFGSKVLGRRGRTLSGELTYDNRHFQPYGAADIDIPAAVSSLELPASLPEIFTFGRYGHPFSLGKARGAIAFGDGFDDLSHVNYRVALDGGYAHGGREQVDVNVRATVGTMIRPKHGFIIELRERGAFDIEKSEGEEGDRSASILTMAPRYLLRLSKFSLSAGFNASWVLNEYFGQDMIVIAPAFDGKWNLAGGRFVPFFSLSSQLLDGSYEALSRRNPFLIPINTAPTGWSNDLRTGFSGSIGGIFTYRLSGGISLLSDYHIFVAQQDIMVGAEGLTGGRPAGTRAGEGEVSGEGMPGPGQGAPGGSGMPGAGTGELVATYAPAMFNVGVADGARFTVGAEIGLHNLGGFSAELYADLHKFSLDGTFYQSPAVGNPVGDLPSFEAGVHLSYSLGDVLTLNLSADLIGKREYNTAYTIAFIGQGPPVVTNGAYVNRLDPVVDVSFGAEVKAADRFWIFVEGKNLANQRLYPYNHYRGLGANVTAGIKAVF